MVDFNQITLKINCLNAGIKRQRFSNWIKNSIPTWMMSTRKPLDRQVGFKKGINTVQTQIKNKTGISLLISDNADFRTNNIAWEKKDIIS